MNTKIIMTATAVTLAIAGLLCTFMPAEIVHYFNGETSKTLLLLLQISGALYFGFAMLNWMTRTSIIGGIYNKPVAAANFAHFFIAGSALDKGLLADPQLPYVVWAIAITCTVFAIAFGIIFYKNPPGKKQQS